MLPIQLDAIGNILPGGVQVLAMGGADKFLNITNTAEIFTDGFPDGQWAAAASMNQARRFLNGVLLPDGNVIAIGGEKNPCSGGTCLGLNLCTPVYEAELFTPSPLTGGSWTLLPAMARPRQYHSTAVLLADGSVLSAGGDTDAEPTCGIATGGPTAQLYKPGYFFRGTRPCIDNNLTPTPMSYGGGNFTITMTTADATRIQKVYLIRPSSVTHSFDAGQRMLSLNISGKSGNQVTVNTPNSADIATPGYYIAAHK